MNYQKVCLYCRGAFITFHRKRKYCSKNCSNLGLQKRIERQCLYCGQIFKVRLARFRNGGGKYCSRKCYDASGQEIRACPICKKNYTTRKKDGRKTCSLKCGYQLKSRNYQQIKRIVKGNCIACDQEFEIKKYRAQKFCSANCRQHYAPQKIAIQCLNCGKEFITWKSQGRKFCSRSCASSGEFNHWYGTSRKGSSHPWFGKNHNETAKQKMREAALQRPPPSIETRKKLATWIGRQHSEETKSKMSKTRKKIWSDSTFRNKMTTIFPLWQSKKPNQLEKTFQDMFSSDIYYTGNGQWWRLLPNGQRKNPDFKVRDQNKVIEVFGDYWHRNDNPGELISLYKQAGVDCLVVWENEIKNQPQVVLDKINQFILH